MAGGFSAYGVYFESIDSSYYIPDANDIDTGAGIHIIPVDSAIVPADFAGTEIEDRFVDSELLSTLIADPSKYVGYIIEKERYVEDTDEFLLVEKIVVEKRNITKFIDYRVAYGETYRYRIRSIYKYVNSLKLPIFEDTDSSFAGQQNTLAKALGGAGNATAYYYYFDSDYSDYFIATIVDTERPSEPYNIQLFPNSLSKNIFITWNQKNTDRDVIGFNIYRKQKGESAFKILNPQLLDIRNNFYIDNDVDYDIDYVYAIESVDIHDLFSKLSAQYSARIKSFELERTPDEERNENKQKFEQIQGLEVNEEPEVKQYKEFIKFNKQFEIICNPTFKNSDEEPRYLLKIKSLDTGTEKQIKINFTTEIINHIPKRLLPGRVDIPGSTTTSGGGQSEVILPTIVKL